MSNSFSSIQTAMELTEMHSLMDNTFTRLMVLWTTYGHNEDALKQRKSRLVKNLKDLCEDMVAAEQQRETEMRKAIKLKMEKITELSRHLGLDPDLAAYGPTCVKTLLDQDAELAHKKQDLEEKKKVRMARYDYLREQEQLICEELEEPIAIIEFDGIPHDDQVAELDSVVRRWKEEKITRTTAVERLQGAIGSLFTALEKSPVTNVEKMAMATAAPKLTSKNIKDLENLLSAMQSQFEKNRDEAESLRKRIRDLWKRLSTPAEITDAFESKYTGCKPSVIQELKRQLAELEEEKMRNIERFTTEIRKEIIEVWDKCYVNELERLKFSEIQSTDYSEDLLVAHENELTRWRDYFQTNKKLIEAVTYWTQHWTNLIQLEAQDDDPVLIANRGGARLKHEKAKKGEQKLCEKYEKDIKKLNDEYLVEHGNYFQIKGNTVQDYIEELKEFAKNEREERKHMKKKLAEETRAMTPGSRKRGCPITPSSKQLGSSKKSKFALPSGGGTFVRTPGEISYTRQIAASISKKVRKSLRKARASKHNGERTMLANDTTLASMKQTRSVAGGNNTRFIPAKAGEELISQAISYSEFTNHLLASNGLSSSVCQPLGQQNSTVTRSATRQEAKKQQLQLPRAGVNDLQNHF